MKRWRALLVGIAVTLSCGLCFYSVQRLQAQSAPVLKLGDPLPENLFVQLAKVINPAVVNISTSQLPRPEQPRRPGPQDPFFDLFQQLFGGLPQRVPRHALGTGFIIRKDGLILTNNHVIDRADIINVQLSETDHHLYQAEIVGRDQRTDVALIKISTKKDLPVAMLGSSHELKVGQWVVAFGNPFGHGHTVTKGIISALHREITDLNQFPFIQTDASINPGNSGGPLVNTKGEVIGVNTAIDVRAQGIGFAIPIDDIKAEIPSLEKDGVIKRGFIGVYLAPVDEDAAKALGLDRTDGALVTQTVDGSPAQKAGLKPYDFIVEFDGHKISSTNDLINIVSTASLGKKVEVIVLRDGKKRTFHLTVGASPSDETRPHHSRGDYQGESAPFDLGFKAVNDSKNLLQRFGLPKLKTHHPIVTEVEQGSPADASGLAPGDVILDVNKRPVHNVYQMTHQLKKQATNLLRVRRADSPLLIFLKS